MRAVIVAHTNFNKPRVNPIEGMHHLDTDHTSRGLQPKFVKN
jgi:hypothetical protein